MGPRIRGFTNHSLLTGMIFQVALEVDETCVNSSESEWNIQESI